MILPKDLQARSTATASSTTAPTVQSSQAPQSSTSLVKSKASAASSNPVANNQLAKFANSNDSLIRIKSDRKMAKPEWHAPWKLKTVISGHTGWVRCLAVDVSNEWFASGAGDRIIKIWDLASGTLKLSLTGHISTVRGLCVSDRHPYLFSAGEDKQIKCWDLEYNKASN